jgi:hypothetical protein
MSSKVVNESSMFYMDFCPNCSNILHLDEYMGEVRHKCQVCPYFSPIKNVTLASRSFYKLKVRIVSKSNISSTLTNFKLINIFLYICTFNMCQLLELILIHPTATNFYMIHVFIYFKNSVI